MSFVHWLQHVYNYLYDVICSLMTSYTDLDLLSLLLAEQSVVSHPVSIKDLWCLLSFRGTFTSSVRPFPPPWLQWTLSTEDSSEVRTVVTWLLSEDQSKSSFDFLSPVFSGKMITAAYVPLPTYHNLFPDSATATQQLAPPPRRWSTNAALWLDAGTHIFLKILTSYWTSLTSEDDPELLLVHFQLDTKAPPSSCWLRWSCLVTWWCDTSLLPVSLFLISFREGAHVTPPLCVLSNSWLCELWGMELMWVSSDWSSLLSVFLIWFCKMIKKCFLCRLRTVAPDWLEHCSSFLICYNCL